MAQVIVSDYFYGDESKEFSYFRIPRLLITHQRFKNISVEAKLLYGLLLDRMGLSEEHGWYDEDGRVFIYYTVEEIADDLCCGRDKAMKLLAAKLYDLKAREQNDKIASERRSQVGTGDRSERIRTYNYPQSRITDHRIGFTIYNMESFLAGNIDTMIDALATADTAEKLKNHQDEN